MAGARGVGIREGDLPARGRAASQIDRRYLPIQGANASVIASDVDTLSARFDAQILPRSKHEMLPRCCREELYRQNELASRRHRQSSRSSCEISARVQISEHYKMWLYNIVASVCGDGIEKTRSVDLYIEKREKAPADSRWNDQCPERERKQQFVRIQT